MSVHSLEFKGSLNRNFVCYLIAYAGFEVVIIPNWEYFYFPGTGYPKPWQNPGRGYAGYSM